MENPEILIVDDEIQVIKSISRVLMKENYRISSAQSGDEALELISKNRFKVIVADVKMSKMDGLELLDKVHEMDPDIARVVLSGHTNVELILNLVNAKGIDKYLLKPWENDDLILAIDTCVEFYNLRQRYITEH
jgi:DNA-binding NtrC family response regulator